MRRTLPLALAGLAAVLLLDPPGAAQPAANVPARLQKLPDGWKVKESFIIPNSPVAGVVARVSNTVLTVEGREIKINLIECASADEAAKVFAALIRGHEKLPAKYTREGNTVVEFVYGDKKDNRYLERAYVEFAFTPARVTYDVSFQAAPVAACDYMKWNPMFSACIARPIDEKKIGDLAKAFTFGDMVRVRNFGPGGEKATFAFTPKPRDSKDEADGEVTLHTFADLPRRHGLPDLGVRLTVISDAYAVTPTKRKAGPELLGPTEFWPSDDAEVVALAKQITAGKTTARDKTAAILAWIGPEKNLKYAGDDPGSRFGVKKVLKQGFGRCWDFSDAFITLARASGVPCRQVLGWVFDPAVGHVWVEVLLEGEGWRQVDPTAGMGCDCRYIPIFANESGKMSLVYTSPVQMKARR